MSDQDGRMVIDTVRQLGEQYERDAHWHLNAMRAARCLASRDGDGHCPLFQGV
ncbi:hypothetical protein [Burkholderia ubonensis]|uniref:hypothetical protein n=1 Tax=Burkholderia ubonensis TaxID=101571 RepID=UPI0012FD6BC4|nr:hypothetical protein [Burkholderia ubonensis]